MKEAKALHPLLEEKYFVGAMLDAADGNLDPEGTTHAYAKSARIDGAEIYQNCRVTDLKPRKDGTLGRDHRATAISMPSMSSIAAGCGRAKSGRMVGLELPVLAMEHMYLVTDDMPEVVAYNKERGRELPHIIDFKSEIYMRQERSGIVLGTYEKACKPWQPKQTPWDFGTGVAAARSRPHRAVARARLQAFSGAGQGRHQARHQRALHLLAGRQSAGRPGAGPAGISGAPAPSWRASARAAASAWRCRNGWSTAIRASMSGPWTSRASANGRRAPTPTRRCARIMRAASPSASPTRSCRRRGRSRRRRSTTR